MLKRQNFTMHLEIMKDTVDKLKKIASLAEGMYTKQEFCKAHNVTVEELDQWPFFRYLPLCKNFIDPKHQSMKAAGVDFYQYV